jgi:hypothetical protein
MNRQLPKMICRLLIALMIWTPFHLAQAGMIGNDQVMPSQASADRTALLDMLNRADVAIKLQSLGIDPAQAKDRVQAMSNEEVAALNSNINSLPAGAMSDGAALLLIIIIVAAVWWYMGDRRGR